MIELEHDLLAENDRQAAHNRGWLAGRGVIAINLVSSPGAGKTTILERTLRALPDALPTYVIEGDQETDVDAERIRAIGRPVVQINTGAGCHLDARMVARAMTELDPPAGSLVLIENVGNLVCPALFDLGENERVVIASVTEGDDKPLKYPHIFRSSGSLLLNKIDLLPYVPFDVQRFTEAARRVAPRAAMRTVSATTGEGLDGWIAWLHRCAERTTSRHRDGSARRTEHP